MLRRTFLGLALGTALSSSALATPPQQARVEATVSRVRVDVIVTDERGAFVSDLGAEDFALTEDGVPQPVSGVELVDLISGLSTARANEVVAERAPLESATLEARYLSTPVEYSDPAELAAVVVVVNGLDIGFRGYSRFARRWASVFDELGAVDVPHSVVLIDFLGYAHQLARFSRDPLVLRSAGEKIRGRSNADVKLASGFVANAGGVFFGSPVPLIARTIRTLALLHAVVETLGERPGRKAMVLVSGDIGFIEYGVPGRAGAPGADDRALRAQRRFERNANSAGVSVYGPDPDLITWRTPAVGASSREGPVDAIRRRPFAFASVSAGRNTLAEISDATGGRAFLRQPDLRGVLRDIHDETARFYLLSYTPPAPPKDGEYHRIRVDVHRPGTVVRARDGYYDLSRTERQRRFDAARELLEERGPLTLTGRR